MAERDEETKAAQYGAEVARLQAAAAVRKAPRISWTDFSGRHAQVLLERSVLGSAPSAQFVVADPTVSRIHAELDPKEDGVWVRDLGSRNGTFVAGVLVSGARIPWGGNIRVGNTTISVEVVETPRNEPELWPTHTFGHLVGRSTSMRRLFHYLSTIAASDASVLIRGETGTGKEAVARSIHEASPRRTQPFVVVDCGAIPENLIESELFGSARGAFTGAQNARVGALEAADGGTVFFDEIGEMPLLMQPKLLRVLESREVRRLGETQPRKMDVRFLFASHRDLRQMVNSGAFREDLYFRMAVVPVEIPPLREHLDDLPDLFDHFLPPGAMPASPEVLAELAKRPWFGNVRELRNFVDRSVIMGAERALRMSMSSTDGAVSERPSERYAVDEPAPTGPAVPDSAPAALPVSTEQTFRAFREAWVDCGEREYVRALLERHGRKVAAAATSADMDRRYLYRLIRKHAL